MNIIDLMPTLATTWPASALQAVGPFTVPTPDPGGNRVNAARLTDPTAKSAQEAEVTAAQAAMEAQGQRPLFQVLNHQKPLSDLLDAQGYAPRDETYAMVIRSADLAATPPPVTAFTIWPPLAIQAELWEAGGIDITRRDIMDRADCPKISLFGRMNDKPAGVAFIGSHNGIAMLHALEIAPFARRKGLAAHMMRTAAKWAEDTGAPWLAILVTQQNVAAQGLYASLGMKPVGTYHYRERAGGSAQ